MKTHFTEYRVIYGDSDPFNVVYYANYFNFFERGRTEFFRSLGIPYTEVQKRGIFLPVTETYCRYLKPAKYDDLLIIETRIDYIKKASIKFSYNVYRKHSQERLAEGYTIHAFVDINGKILKIPKDIKKAVETLFTES